MSQPISFHIPFVPKEATVMLKDDLIRNMKSYSTDVRTNHSENYEKLERVVSKTAPIALAAILFIGTFPVWFVAKLIASPLLGALSWAIPATAGAMLWSECKETANSFKEGAAPLYDCMVAGITKVYTTITEEIAAIHRKVQ